MIELQTGNLLKSVPQELFEEQITAIAGTAGTRIERIVSSGHATPEGEWYDQDGHEWVMVVRGAARLAFEDGSGLDMERGDHVLIPARCRHRVEWTSESEPTVWLAVHFDAEENESRR